MKDNEKFCSHCGAARPVLKNNVEETVEQKTPDNKETSQSVVEEKKEMNNTLPAKQKKKIINQKRSLIKREI